MELPCCPSLHPSNGKYFHCQIGYWGIHTFINMHQLLVKPIKCISVLWNYTFRFLFWYEKSLRSLKISWKELSFLVSSRLWGSTNVLHWFQTYLPCSRRELELTCLSSSVQTGPLYTVQWQILKLNSPYRRTVVSGQISSATTLNVWYSWCVLVH